MPKRKAKKVVQEPPTPPECDENSLGLSPAVLAKRGPYKPEVWCPKADPAIKVIDPHSDPKRPKTIHYSDVVRARRVLKKVLTPTPIKKTNNCPYFDTNLYFKLETGYKTGSFHERGAIYALHMLTPEQRRDGVVTASLGNWALALSSEAQKMDIPVTVVFPLQDHLEVMHRCKDLGAKVEFVGKNLADTNRAGLTIIQDSGVGTYINGYDHPHVIAGEGTIAIEILEQLPETDVILVPVGGGGLIAGIAAVVKKIRPEILIYGVETNDGSCFFKALEEGKPYKIEVARMPQNVPIAGYNAFHTAQSLIDKMVLVNNDSIAQAIAYLAEEEKLVVERRGALGLAALFSDPNVVPELRCRNVVCILTGSNIHSMAWPRALLRAKIIEGRLLCIEMMLGPIWEFKKVFHVLANLRCNIIHLLQESGSSDMSADMHNSIMTVMCETRGWRHADTIKNVMNKLFPGVCNFSDEFETAQYKCQCFPKIWNI